MKRILGILVILALFSTCTFSAIAEEDYRIALVQKGAEDFFLYINKGFTDAVSDYGVNGAIIDPSTYHNVAEINNAVSQAIIAGYDAIIFVAQDYEANATAVDEAAAMGIPMILVDVVTASDQYVTSICSDNYQAGAAAADQMALYLGEEGGTVAIFGNESSSESDYQRQLGFIERCQEAYPQIQPMETQWYIGDIARCSTQVTDTLTANPDLAGIFCINNSSSTAAANVLISLGLDKQLSLIGFDSDADEIKLLEEGVISALIVQQPYMMGYMGVEYALDALNGKEVAHENHDPGCMIVTAENMNDPDVAKILNPLAE